MRKSLIRLSGNVVSVSLDSEHITVHCCCADWSACFICHHYRLNEKTRKMRLYFEWPNGQSCHMSVEEEAALRCVLALSLSLSVLLCWWAAPSSSDANLRRWFIIRQTLAQCCYNNLKDISEGAFCHRRPTQDGRHVETLQNSAAAACARLYSDLLFLLVL